MSPTEMLRYNQMEEYGYGPNVMRKNKVCNTCGRIASAKLHSCPACGDVLPSETLFDRYKRHHTCCADCDTVLAPGSLYCPNCGKAVLYQEYNSGGGNNNEK